MQQRLKVPVVRINETKGNAVTSFDRQTTPIGRVVEVHLPFASFVWHRPVAVEVRQEDTTYRLPVQDSTSRVIGAIVLTGLVTVLVPLVMRKILFRRRRSS